MPMGTDSNKVAFDECNLWLVNERLAFHNYLASDKTLTSMPITGSTSTKEPDLLALHVYDNPILVSEGSKLPLASITVVELKKPMRNDAKSGELPRSASGIRGSSKAGRTRQRPGRRHGLAPEAGGYSSRYFWCFARMLLARRSIDLRLNWLKS